MSADMKERIRNCSSNEELRKAIEWNEALRSALKNSLSVLVDLLNSAFSEVSLKDKRFQMFSPCTEEELTNYHLPNDRFDENISELKKEEHLKNFPKFKEFLRTHTTRRTYYSHVFKCSTDDCPFHFPVAGQSLSPGRKPRKNVSLLSWKILQKGVTLSLSQHWQKLH